MPGGIRTPNRLIRSQLLYPVELQTHSWRQTQTRGIQLAPQACVRDPEGRASARQNKKDYGAKLRSNESRLQR